MLSLAAQLLGTTGATSAGVVSVLAAGSVAIVSTSSVLSSGGAMTGGSSSAVGFPASTRKYLIAVCLCKTHGRGSNCFGSSN